MHTARVLVLAASLSLIAGLCDARSVATHEIQRRETPDYASAGKIDLGDAVLGIASLIVNIITSTIKGQQKQRAAYTQGTAQGLRNKYPTKNVVIFHNQDSTYNFTNGEHFHHEVDLYRSLGTYGYEIWIFDSGTFHLAGDGGFMNWSFGGVHERIGDRDVEFFPIDPPEVAPPALPSDQPIPPQWPARRWRNWLLYDGDGDGNDSHDTESPPRRRGMEAEDGNYLLDCHDSDGTGSSGIAYFRKLIPGHMVGRTPNDYVEVSRGHHFDWETSSTAHFPSRNITLTWSILGDSEDAKLDQTCGLASNGHEAFWLYKASGQFLFAEVGKRCNAMYWGF